MQVDAKLAELESRVGNLQHDVTELTKTMNHIAHVVDGIATVWNGNGGNPPVPIRMDRIEQRSLSKTESETLISTKMASWATLAGVGVMILLWVMDKLPGFLAWLTKGP